MSIKDIAAKGRYGDNHLLHVSDAEVQGLNALAHKTLGHGLTTNPETGLPEAFAFLPFLTPLFSGAVGTGLGLGASSALATGLTAGTLGTVEGLAKGEDFNDALKQGVFTGLTAGAAQGIGNTFSEMGAEAAAAEGAMNPVQNMPVDPVAKALPQTPTNVPLKNISGYPMSPAPTVDPLSGMPQSSGMGSILNPPTPQTPMVNVGGGPNPAEFVAQPQAIAPTAEPSFMDTAIEKFTPSSEKIAGMQKAFGSNEGFKEFMDKGGQASLATGMVGLGGTASLDAEQEMKAKKEAMEAEDREKYFRMVDKIKANYAEAGRPLPTSPYGPMFQGPNTAFGFKEGKKVKSPEQQAYEDRTFNTYDEQVADEPWYTRVPVQVLEKMGIRDPYRLQRAMDANKEVDNRAAGGYLEGGIASLKGDGMSDSVPAKIDGSQPAALSTGEYVIPADVVSHLGNGSSDDGAVRLDEMLDRVRMARTGTEDQAPQIDPEKYLPA